MVERGRAAWARKRRSFESRCWQAFCWRRSPAALRSFPPAGTYSYAASCNGEAVGKWSVNVKSAQAGPEIDENSTASLMGMQLAAQAALMLSADLSPTLYDGHYRTPNQSPNVERFVDANLGNRRQHAGRSGAQIALVRVRGTSS